MQGATIEELRELSRRSRRAQACGFFALAGLLVLVPVTLMLPAWALYALVGAGGLGLLTYAYAVGQERGAFRRVFRRIRDDQRATRSIVPDMAPAPLVTLLEKK